MKPMKLELPAHPNAVAPQDTLMLVPCVPVMTVRVSVAPFMESQKSSEAEPQTATMFPFRLARPYVVLPRLRRGSRLDGEKLGSRMKRVGRETDEGGKVARSSFRARMARGNGASSIPNRTEGPARRL